MSAPTLLPGRQHHARSRQHPGAFLLSHDVQERDLDVEGKHCKDKQPKGNDTREYCRLFETTMLHTR
jgi:hypothetical protein